jgi:hypothetical protein
MSEGIPMRQLPAQDYARLKHATRKLIRACGGLVAAGEIVGYSKTQLHRWGDINHAAFMPIDVAADLETECGKAYVTQVLSGMASDGIEPHRPCDPLDRMGELAKECGEAGSAYRVAHSDFSGTCATAALKEIDEAIEALTGARRDIESRQESANVEPMQREAR